METINAIPTQSVYSPTANNGVTRKSHITTNYSYRATNVEMVNTIHHGENRGTKPVILYMFYLSQKGEQLAVQHPEIPLECPASKTANDDFVLFWPLSQPRFPDDISKLFTTDFVQPILQQFVTH